MESKINLKLLFYLLLIILFSLLVVVVLARQNIVFYQELSEKNNELNNAVEENGELILENKELTAENERLEKNNSKVRIEADDIFALSGDDVRKMTKEVFKSNRRVEIEIFDKYFYYLPLEVWKKIIEEDSTDISIYLGDKRDCDDFGQNFKTNIWKTLLNERHALNGVGIIYIEKKDINNKIDSQYHVLNILIAQVDNEPKLFFLEPQTDALKEISQKVIIDGKKVIPLRVSWY